MNIPSGYGLKGQLEYESDCLYGSGTLILKLPARRAMIDHIVSCPEIYGKAMQPKTTKKGCVENGMEDEVTHTYPDLYRMLKAYKLQDFKQEYDNLLYENFSELYQTMKKNGHIPEELYNMISFLSDANYNGDEIEKPDGISQEMRHRAKILSHDPQRKLQQKKEEAAVAGLKTKINTDFVVCHDIFTRNDKTMKNIFLTGEESPLEELQTKDFKPPSVKQLRAFIHIRLFDTGTIPNGQGSKILKNKGNVAEAESGVKNIMCVAYNCRGLPIKLVRPATINDGKVILEEDNDNGSSIEEDDDGSAIEIDEETDEENNPPRSIGECSPSIPIVTPPRPSNESWGTPSQ